MFRIEGELGYKHGTAKSVDLENAFIDAINTEGRARHRQRRLQYRQQDQRLVGNDQWLARLRRQWPRQIGGGVGAGVGYAGVHEFNDSHSTFAWQLLAQAYYPVQRPDRYRPEVSLLPCRQEQWRRHVRVRQPRRLHIAGSGDLLRWRGDPRRQCSVRVAQPVAEPDLQLRISAAAAAAATSAAATSAATSGDSDVPGRIGDPGDGYVPGTAAAAASGACAAGRTRRKLSRLQRLSGVPPLQPGHVGEVPAEAIPPGFLMGATSGVREALMVLHRSTQRNAAQR